MQYRAHHSGGGFLVCLCALPWALPGWRGLGICFSCPSLCKSNWSLQGLHPGPLIPEGGDQEPQTLTDAGIYSVKLPFRSQAAGAREALTCRPRPPAARLSPPWGVCSRLFCDSHMGSGPGSKGASRDQSLNPLEGQRRETYPSESPGSGSWHQPETPVS